MDRHPPSSVGGQSDVDRMSGRSHVMSNALDRRRYGALGTME